MNTVSAKRFVITTTYKLLHSQEYLKAYSLFNYGDQIKFYYLSLMLFHLLLFSSEMGPANFHMVFNFLSYFI